MTDPTGTEAALGEASMCWDPRPDGVFDSTRAARIGELVVHRFGYVMPDGYRPESGTPAPA